jgi:hypothetical protein
MACTSSIGGSLLAAVLIFASGTASAFDDATYPDWKGQWHRLPVPGITGAASFDPTKRLGREQQAPLTAEYQKVSKTIWLSRRPAGMALAEAISASRPACRWP